MQFSILMCLEILNKSEPVFLKGCLLEKEFVYVDESKERIMGISLCNSSSVIKLHIQSRLLKPLLFRGTDIDTYWIDYNHTNRTLPQTGKMNPILLPCCPLSQLLGIRMALGSFFKKNICLMCFEQLLVSNLRLHILFTAKILNSAVAF